MAFLGPLFLVKTDAGDVQKHVAHAPFGVSAHSLIGFLARTLVGHFQQRRLCRFEKLGLFCFSSNETASAL